MDVIYPCALYFLSIISYRLTVSKFQCFFQIRCVIIVFKSIIILHNKVIWLIYPFEMEAIRPFICTIMICDNNNIIQSSRINFNSIAESASLSFLKVIHIFLIKIYNKIVVIIVTVAIIRIYT